MAVLAIGGVAAATFGVTVRGGDGSGAVLKCPGGMDRMSHVLSENASVFPGDPAPVITVLDFGDFLIEEISIGTHTSTHIDAPNHFGYIASIDDFAAEDFVWPAYVIDTRSLVDQPGITQLSWQDVKAYEDEFGRIKPGSMVIVYNDIDGLFESPGFASADPAALSPDAIDKLFERREIAGIGGDWFGPDAGEDDAFSSTNQALANEGLVLTNLNNIGTLSPRGDIVISPAVPLINGSGFQVDPLACHGDSGERLDFSEPFDWDDIDED